MDFGFNDDDDDGDDGDSNEAVFFTTPGEDGLVRLLTPIQPSDANHSFSGVIFDVQAVGLEPVVVLGVAVGGEIGPYTVYYKPTTYRSGYKLKDGWTVVGKGVEGACWRGSRELRFQTPVVVPCGARVALYIHSSLPHDRGIMYQTFPSYDATVCRDDNLCIYPGEARVGHVAFMDEGEQNENGRWGWYGARCGAVHTWRL